MISTKIHIRIEGDKDDIQQTRNDLVESLTNYELTRESVQHPNLWEEKLNLNEQNSLMYLNFRSKR